ncbi:MAG: type II toxin-antitoxin system PemK/MazF family toxin [Pirellulales bacterium]
MKVHRGDIVLVDYPFSDRTGSKVRPTLVVSTDELHQEDDAVVVAITSVVRTSIKPSEMMIDPGKPDARGSGLLSNSVIECWNIATIDQGFIVRRIGRLSAGIMKKVAACLRAAFGL